MKTSCRALVLAIFLAGCGTSAEEESPKASDTSDSDQAIQCEDVIEAMAVCYPDLSSQASCTAETLAQFEQLDGEPDCLELERLGKADWFAFGGCDIGEHVCGWMFCCDDSYEIGWYPNREADWDIVGVVQGFQAAAPSDAVAKITGASREDLQRGVGVTFNQDVAEYPSGNGHVAMAVELTAGLVDVLYQDFILRMLAEHWGIELAHYLGGEVKVYERDEQGRATRQLERMVLSPLPFDIEMPLTNNDMTKVEVIEYANDRATVYWRVMFSDNDSTETDVGSVEFRAYDESSTLITFHSAHRLNAPGGLHIPNDLVRVVLKKTFLDFVDHYRAITGE